MAEPQKAAADRTGDILRVTCPHCGRVNEFPEFASVDVFICDQCGEPVEVVELEQ